MAPQRWFLIALCLWLTMTACCCQAATHIVIDTDGSVEDYTALTMLSRLDAGTHSSSVKIISVHNTGWGFAATTSLTMKRFISLLPLPNAQVTLGAFGTRAETTLATKVYSCVDARGFPSSPHDAAQRRMPFSRAEISTAFTMATTEESIAVAQPLLQSLPPLLSGPPTVTTDSALSQLVRTSASADRIVYLQLGGGSSSTLVEILDRWQREQPHLLTKFLAMAQVHVSDSGRGGGTALYEANALFTYSRQLTTPLRLYVPSFFSPSLEFTEALWSTFSSAAQSSSSVALQWAYGVLAAKKSRYTASSTFYSSSSLTTTLVTFCAVEPYYLKHLCPSYATPAYSLIAARTTMDSITTTTTSYLEQLTGNNVTFPFIYSGNLTIDDSTISTATHLYTGLLTDPSETTNGDESLSTSFWTTLLSLLY